MLFAVFRKHETIHAVQDISFCLEPGELVGYVGSNGAGKSTTGLDVAIKDKIRKFIRNLRDEKNTTIILTTHDMTDIDEICDRIIMIEKGKKLFDQPLSEFKHIYNDEYYMDIEFENQPADEFDQRFHIVSRTDKKLVCSFKRNEVGVREAMIYFAGGYDISDINIRNPNLEEIIRDFYNANN